MMCATSRMVVKRQGAERPTVVPCTLIPYDAAFEMGADAGRRCQADGGMFAAGAVKLCHPHCSKFCVLGGGSCSAVTPARRPLSFLHQRVADLLQVDLGLAVGGRSAFGFPSRSASASR